MLAYIYDSENALSLQERPRPDHAAESALIRVGACSICGTDMRTYRYGNARITPPRIVGHEICGELVAVGDRVKDYSPGQRVQVTPAIGCGSCGACVKGYSNLCDRLTTIGFQYDGGFAEFMEIPAVAFRQKNVSIVPDELSDLQAALAEPVACVINGQEFLDIRDEDTVVVFGSGFIGCLHAEIARMKGAERILIVEISNRRAAKARQLQPEAEVIEPSGLNLSEQLLDLTGGNGADVVVTACSSGQAQADALCIAAKRGRVSLFGGLPGDSMGFVDSNLIHYKELSVYGVHASTPVQNRTALDWIGKGRIDVEKYIEATFALDQIPIAFEQLQEEKVFKAIVTPAAKGYAREGK